MFESESDLKYLVDRWSNCTLPGPEFTHKAHIAVCAYIAWYNSSDDTYTAMKDGLYRFNQAVGTPNNDERGYHETLTRFWCMLLYEEIAKGAFQTCLEATNNMLDKYGNDSRADRAHYSFDVLKSKEARKTWIAPDISVDPC